MAFHHSWHGQTDDLCLNVNNLVGNRCGLVFGDRRLESPFSSCKTTTSMNCHGYTLTVVFEKSIDKKARSLLCFIVCFFFFQLTLIPFACL
jgi:hypothetical protein